MHAFSLPNVAMLHATLQKQNICIIFMQSGNNVEDVEPTLYKWYTNVVVFAGYRLIVSPSNPK